MITNPTGRFVVGVTSDALVAHDRRWRRRRSVELPAGAQIIEGRSALMAVVDDPEAITVQVRRAGDIDTVVASGAYASWNWTFDGTKSAFFEVPEYFVLPRAGGNVLLRVADGAVLTLLDADQGLGDMTTVAALPDSRLVVLSNGSQWAVYDPKTTQAGYHSELADPGATPNLAFSADGSALFMCDRTSLLRLDTKAWTVEDAAGAEPVSPSTGDAGNLEVDRRNAICAWHYDSVMGLVLVAHDNGEVFAIDDRTMEARGSVAFDFASTALRFHRGKVFAQRVDGAVTTRRLTLYSTQ